MKIKIATRNSELAIFQANAVAVELNQRGFDTELVPIVSDGDKTDQPLHEIGGKGLFVSALESSLLSQEVDIAVHSLKDVPAKLNEEFVIAAVLKREDPSDVLITKEGWSMDNIPDNSVIATSSPRRKAQILDLNSNIQTMPVRGNIKTRIDKLNGSEFDGLIVAKAALNRLNLSFENAYEFSVNEMLPSASQGFIGIECLRSNIKIIDLLNKINVNQEMMLAKAERDFVSMLDGSCLSPIAILCTEDHKKIKITAKVLSQDGKKKIYKEITSNNESLNEDIVNLANEFINEGADTLINE